MTELEIQYKKLQDNIMLLRSKRIIGSKKNYSLERIGKILGTGKGNVSKLNPKARRPGAKPVKKPTLVTITRYNGLLEKELQKIEEREKIDKPKSHVKQRNQPSYYPELKDEQDKKLKAQDERIQILESRLAVVEKNTERILALLKSNPKNDPPQSN